jgi:hypothetical protein
MYWPIGIFSYPKEILENKNSYSGPDVFFSNNIWKTEKGGVICREHN